ncbi:uncharacterized protein AtWU_07163 [Aspergillus tubingensis]|uniref:uncharacterized protein n=1 Tax=Aspergillus tubingensis TaxID=5068 RepID=UPI0015791530|nr:uncharacterized protein AtWU_07163 [Aspergillus tubingensis]GFN17361.1 hypothetical protein AtWU_07163 [Aspergillus tubingensis]
MELPEPGSYATRGWSALNDQVSLACSARLLVAAHGRSFVDGFILKSQGRRGAVLLFKSRSGPDPLAFSFSGYSVSSFSSQSTALAYPVPSWVAWHCDS